MAQQIRDENGKVLGYFLTVTEYAGLADELEKAGVDHRLTGALPAHPGSGDDVADDPPIVISGE